MEFNGLGIDVLHRSEQSFLAVFFAHDKERDCSRFQVHGAGDMQDGDWERIQLSGHRYHTQEILDQVMVKLLSHNQEVG